MSKDELSPLSANNITSEEQLNRLLENCEISSQSPKNVDWLSHWWEKEFAPNLPPIARYILVVRDEDFALDLCFAIENNSFVVYMFNHQNYWFNRLGIMDEFSSFDELGEYLNKLVNQNLIDWKKWMKENRP